MIDKKAYIELLKQLIATPSISRDENGTATLLVNWLSSRGIDTRRIGNNVIARQRKHDTNKPTLMLNSHHDTVKPNQGYTRDPFNPTVEDDRLYGLGSNDAGGALVSLIATFIDLADTVVPFNIVLCLSCEEECSGVGGMRKVIKEIGHIDMAIVGEPTGMRCAVGERGLIVLDCLVTGKSGHAARNEGINAIELAINDIQRLHSIHFEKESRLMGPIGINVTMINAGTQHNVIPAKCNYVVDVRTTDAYTNEETVDIISQNVTASVTPRSTHLRASAIDNNHPLIKAIDRMGIELFLSPTMSDMALMPFPSIKIGPGDSSRSHTADEYINITEIESAIDIYIKIIQNISI